MTRRVPRPYVASLRQAKRAGVSRDEARKILINGINASALKHGWLPSEQAMSLASADDALNAVYGKERS